MINNSKGTHIFNQVKFKLSFLLKTQGTRIFFFGLGVRVLNKVVLKQSELQVLNNFIESLLDQQ